ncbi:hypothetical protein ACFQY7_05095 [Actinomadura luteofluorescens]|uniref:hypothetical protein n=1 Tax=Actinomadura luteofluorescens TaxID=46163 RepID=UPI003639EBA3
MPPYAPELNPVESVWAHLKRSLANPAKHAIDQLMTLIKTRLKRVQRRPPYSTASSPHTPTTLVTPTLEALQSGVARQLDDSTMVCPGSQSATRSVR